MRTGKALVAAAAVIAALGLAACGGGPPKPSVDTCATAIEAHPHANTMDPACKGLTASQLWEATTVAMAHGARG
jgi:hypothetical protein